MKCKFEKRLEDFHHGELGAKKSAEVQSHVESCTNCRRVLELLEAEDRRYASYARELEINFQLHPQVWERVRAGIETPGRRKVGRLEALSRRILPHPPVLRYAAFASALVAMTAALTLTGVHYFRAARGTSNYLQTAQRSSESVRQANSGSSLEAAILAIRHAEGEYIEAIGVLSKIVDKRKPNLDPQLVAEVERNLKAIDEGIAATRAAYYAHPSDPDLAHYMLVSYEKKVELLLELAS